MLVYRLCQSDTITDPLSAEGACKNGGRWHPPGYPILYTSATPELAVLEVTVHLHVEGDEVPDYHLIVLDIPDECATVEEAHLPENWRTEEHTEPLQTYLQDWLDNPQHLIMQVPSAVVSRSNNYLIHTGYSNFTECVNVLEVSRFEMDNRLAK